MTCVWPLLPGFHWRYHRLQQRRLRHGRWSVSLQVSTGPSVPSLWTNQPEKNINIIPVCLTVWIVRFFFNWWQTGVDDTVFHLIVFCGGLLYSIWYPPLPQSRKRPVPACTSSRCRGTGWGRWQTVWGFLGAKVRLLSLNDSDSLGFYLWRHSTKSQTPEIKQ